MPRLTVLISCLGDAVAFEQTLASVLQNRPTDSEVVVVHTEPYADPYQLSGEVCFVQVNLPQRVTSAAANALMLNAGFEAARSSVVQVLQAGWEVTEGWADAALAQFEEEKVGLVSPMIASKHTPQKPLAIGWELHGSGRCQLLRALPRKQDRSTLAPTAVSGFYRRALWRHLRWDSECGETFAPLGFAIAAQGLGFSTYFEKDSVIVGETWEALRQDQPLGFADTKTLESLFWRRAALQHADGVHWWTLLNHAGWISLETIAALPKLHALSGLAGRCWGIWQRQQSQRFAHEMQLLQSKLESDVSQPLATVPFPQRATLDHNSTKTTRRRAA